MSIHRAPDGPAGARVARHQVVPYSDNAVAFAAAFVGVMAFGIYLRTMMPSTGFWDTAEAQTVPATLSIFHPTGFPTYAMLGWLWSQLPVGEVAWRMNLLSGVCIALAAALVVLIAGHLISQRHAGLAAAAAGVAGAVFAFAPEPWENAARADVHAVNVFFVALVMWLLFAWRAAERAGAPRAGGWLIGAALAFGIGMGAHPLVGLLAFGIVAWLLVVDVGIWRRWRLILACAAVLALGMATYAYIPVRALIDPEPPLFYARPDTWERLRYLVFAEQFRGLFDSFETPLANLGAKWADAERVLELQYFGPGWLLVAVGAATLATRHAGALLFLSLVVLANVVYSTNFRDGDIDRYYMPTIVATAPMLGVAVASVGAMCARAAAEASRRLADIEARRRLASLAGAVVILLAAIVPAASLVTQYSSHDQSANRDADRWVASVHEALPPNAVVVSWWSYSTPLWYHRWVLGARSDVTIVDERNIIDSGLGTMHNAIRTYIADRPVYVVPPHWEVERITERWETRTVATYPGFTDLLFIEGRRP
ncbi:MAG: glycosyltransferase family 117 protein [Candidatus Limnocylindria bacterium]